jgi:uncharacterized protein
MSDNNQPASHEIDPTKKTVEFDGKSITLATLAQARDHARATHILPDPYPLVEVEVNELRGMPRGGMQIKGWASVFDRISLDLGGFREKVQPGFFQPVLDRDPDVHAVWDHDTRWVLGRTKNKTLELREDEIGLFNRVQVAPTSYAADLRILMQRGDIDQESFAFNVETDEWREDDAGNILRTLVTASELFDVTITAQGAYPQTSAEVTRSLRDVLGSNRNVFSIVKVGDGAADEAPAVAEPGDGAASSPAVTEVADDGTNFAMWKAAMENKAAARKAALAKLAGRLGRLE